MHLILSTRQDPPLPLNVLRARGELGEIRVQELRFTPEEIALFMQQAIESPLDEQDIAILAERTEGWPAGLRLAALTLITSDDIHGRLVELPADNRYVMDYLMGEVLSHVPAATQDFLLKTSILDRLSGPLCDAVTGVADASGTDRPTWSGWRRRTCSPGASILTGSGIATIACSGGCCAAGWSSSTARRRSRSSTPGRAPGLPATASSTKPSNMPWRRAT